MVVGYNCTDPRDGCTGGYKHECDVGEAGERTCPDCGMEVIGITEDHRTKALRSPHEVFRVDFGPLGNRSRMVYAVSYEEAFEKAEGSYDDKVITRITPVDTE